MDKETLKLNLTIMLSKGKKLNEISDFSLTEGPEGTLVVVIKTLPGESNDNKVYTITT